MANKFTDSLRAIGDFIEAHPIASIITASIIGSAIKGGVQYSKKNTDAIARSNYTKGYSDGIRDCNRAKKRV